VTLQPTFSCIQPGVSFAAYSSVNAYDVIDAVQHLSDKSSATFAMPVSVFNKLSLGCTILHRTVQTRYGRRVQGSAYHTNRQETGMDSTDVSSNFLISNLSVVSKLVERIVVRQLMAYLSSADLLLTLQSGF